MVEIGTAYCLTVAGADKLRIVIAFYLTANGRISVTFVLSNLALLYRAFFSIVSIVLHCAWPLSQLDHSSYSCCKTINLFQAQMYYARTVFLIQRTRESCLQTSRMLAVSCASSFQVWLQQCSNRSHSRFDWSLPARVADSCTLSSPACRGCPECVSSVCRFDSLSMS